MTFKQKINKITFIIVFCVTTFYSCTDENGNNILKYDSIPAQEWFDKYIRHSTIIDENGHTLIMHEIGTRKERNYSFSIEHSTECKKCYDIYD